MEELSDNIYEMITQLVDEGKTLCEEGDFPSSTDKFKKAIRLLPNPRYEWEAFSWLVSGIGLNYMELENWEKAFKFLKYSLLTADEIKDPLIWFSAGKALYNMDRRDESKNLFVKSYILSEDFFNEQDLKYKNLIETDLQIMNDSANLNNDELQ